MLRIARTRIPALYLGSLAIAAATIAVAADQSDQGNQNQQLNQDQQQAQSTGPQLAPQQPTTYQSQQSQQAAQQDQPQKQAAQNANQQNQSTQQVQPNRRPNRRPTDWQNQNRTGNDADINYRLPSGRQLQRRFDSPGRNNRSDRAYNTLNSPSSWQQPLEQPPSRPQGASLGINIIGGSDGQGVVVTRVHPNTPAQQMGLRPNDRITSVNGQSVDSDEPFIATIRRMKPGDQVELTIVRDNGQQTLRGTLEPFNQPLNRFGRQSTSGESRGYQGGAGSDRTDLFSPGQPTQRNSGPAGRENRQTSFDDFGSYNNSRTFPDVDARLSLIEKQIERLTHDIEELRIHAGIAQPNTPLPPQLTPGQSPPTPPQNK